MSRIVTATAATQPQFRDGYDYGVRTTRAQTDRYGNWFDPAPNCCQRLLRERSSSQNIISGTKCHFPGSVLTVFSSNTEFDGMTSNVSSGVSSSDPEVSWRQFKPFCAGCDEMEEKCLPGSQLALWLMCWRVWGWGEVKRACLKL